MSTTYQSTKRNRVYQRKFDHDEMRELAATGEYTRQALADRFGVSLGRINQLLNPNIAAAVAAHVQRNARAITGHCRCGHPMTRASMRKHAKLGNEPRCPACYGLDRATTIRRDALLCTRCGEWKPDDEFPIATSKKARRHRHAFCRPCQAKAKREWRQANPDKVQARVEAYRERRNELLRARRAAKRAAR